MLEVDGSTGGGQILRSALTLSALSGDAVRVEDVRGDRSSPGLKAQHLSVVETLAEIAGADVEGAELGSETVEFDPGRPTGGDYEVDVGTAGSLALLFDAVLPLAARVDEPLTLAATGGTDVKWSPPLAYYRRVKLPLLQSVGLAAVVEPDRTGFYPKGGGEATLRLWPSSLSRIDLADPGPVTGARVYSKASAGLADADVAERQAATAVEELDEAGIEVTERRVTYVESASPGSVVTARVARERSIAGFDAYGERGKPAERVANEALDGVATVVEAGAAVDEHLADQVLLFLALVGGEVAIPRVTDHVASSLDLLSVFGFDASVDEGEKDGEGRAVLRADSSVDSDATAGGTGTGR